MNLFELKEVVNLLDRLIVYVPLVVPLGAFDSAIDRDRHVSNVSGPDRKHVEGVVGGDDHLAISRRKVGLHNSVHECLLVTLLCHE